MKVPFLELTSQYNQLAKEIDAVISEVLSEGSFIGGLRVAKFERDFEQYLAVNHCISCGNATDGLEIALRALNIGSGDEVLIPDLTMAAAAEAVMLVGASPVFVDVDQRYFTADCNKIAPKLSVRSKAIIPVHLYGLAAPMDDIMSIAAENNLAVIEDCAQAHGARYRDEKAGTLGDIGVFSFYPTKNLGAYGDGGAITTNSGKLADACRMIANHGQSKKDIHLRLGRNSRLDTMQAAILSKKLPYLDEWNQRRQKIAALYSQQLTDLPIQVPESPEYSDHVYHLFVIQTDKRDTLKAYLKTKGIDTAIHYPYTLGQSGVYVNKSPVDNTMAVTLTNRILSLPIYPEITNEQVEWVAKGIRDFFDQL